MMIDIHAALLDPTSVFRRPQEVLDCAELTEKQKIQILQRWEYDARELQVAEEENMTAPRGEAESFLEQILKALIKLGVDITKKDTPPTKQG